MTYIYARVSSKEQLANGTSLEAQINKCLAFAAAHGLVLGPHSNCGRDGIFADGGVSATKHKNVADRPGGVAMLKSLQKGDTLLCTSPHRLFRSLLSMLKQIKEWEDLGVNLVFIDMNMNIASPTGRLQLHILGAIAEFKARIIGSRVSEAHAWRRKQGDVSKGSTSASRVMLQKASAPAVEPTSEALAAGRISADLTERRLNPVSKKPKGAVRFYVRVSKATQEVDTQEALLQQWVENTPDVEGLPVHWYVDHGKSAYSKPVAKRPSGARMLEEAKEGDIIVVYRLDRMFRSLKDMTTLVSDLHERGVHLWIVDSGMRTDSQFGRILVEMLAWVAQLESYENDVSSNSAVANSVRTKGLHVSKLPMFLRRGSAHKFEVVKKHWCVQNHLKPSEKDWFIEEWTRSMAINQSREGGKGPWAVTNEVTNRLFEEIGWPRVVRQHTVLEDGSKKVRHIYASQVIEETLEMDRVETGPEFKERRRRRHDLRKALRANIEVQGDKRIWGDIIARKEVMNVWRRTVEWATYLKEAPAGVKSQLAVRSVKALENLEVILGQ
jgi:DNA invertase Pin-like site-specific DNA recombinase